MRFQLISGGRETPIEVDAEGIEFTNPFVIRIRQNVPAKDKAPDFFGGLFGLKALHDLLEFPLPTFRRAPLRDEFRQTPRFSPEFVCDQKACRCPKVPGRR